MENKKNYRLSPQDNRIIVNAARNPYHKKSPIIGAESIAKSFAFGTVVAVGEEADQSLLGAEIYYSIHVGYVVDFIGTDYVVMRDKDIMLVIEEVEDAVTDSAPKPTNG